MFRYLAGDSSDPASNNSAHDCSNCGTNWPCDNCSNCTTFRSACRSPHRCTCQCTNG